MSEKINQPAVPNEWSYLYDVDDIEDPKSAITFAAEECVLPLLARRLGVESVKSASASMTLQILAGKVHVVGSVTAKVTQNCVVSLEPISQEVTESFEAWYADPQAAVSFIHAQKQRDMMKSGKESPITDESDDPESIVDGKIDLGELASQYLSLGIDPYPLAEGVELEGYQEPLNKGGAASQDDEAAALRKNPFLALKNWKGKE